MFPFCLREKVGSSLTYFKKADTFLSWVPKCLLGVSQLWLCQTSQCINFLTFFFPVGGEDQEEIFNAKISVFKNRTKVTMRGTKKKKITVCGSVCAHCILYNFSLQDLLYLDAFLKISICWGGHQKETKLFFGERLVKSWIKWAYNFVVLLFTLSQLQVWK